MSRNSPRQYAHHRALTFFEQTLGLLGLELGLNKDLELSEQHCPRRTINQHVRTLEYCLEQMMLTDERANCEGRLCEMKREIAKRDTSERRRRIQAVMS